MIKSRVSWRALALPSCALLVVAACGKDGGGGSGAGDTSSDTGGQESSLTSVDGSTGPSSMTGTPDTSDTIADSSSSEGSASSDGGESSSTGSAAITVSGRVQGYSGAPSIGAEVTIAGQSATTDDDGAFVLDGVSAPYDIAIQDTAGLTIVRGLTRDDPTLHTFGFSGDAQAANVDGVLFGGAGFPEPAGHEFAVAFDSDFVHDEGSSYSQGDDGDYHLSPQWYGPPSQDGALMALQYTQNVQGQPTGYDGIGSALLSVSDAGTFSDQDLELMPVVDALIGGALAVPPASMYSQLRLFIGTGDRSSVFVGWDDTLGDSYSFIVPEGQGAWSAVALLAGVDNDYVWTFRTAIAPDTMDVDLDIPVVPSWTSPANGTTLAADDDLTWSGIPDAATYVALYCENSDFTVTLVDVGDSTTIPDLSAFGTLLVPGSSCTVMLEQYGPYADLDAWASPVSPTANRERVFQSYPSAALFDGSYSHVEGITLTAE